MSNQKDFPQEVKHVVYNMPNWALPLMEAKSSLNKLSNLAEENKLLEALSLTHKALQNLSEVCAALCEAIERQKTIEKVIEQHKSQELI